MNQANCEEISKVSFNARSEARSWGPSLGIGIIAPNFGPADFEIANDIFHRPVLGVRSMTLRISASLTIPRFCSSGLKPNVLLKRDRCS